MSRAELTARGWDRCDVILVTGDAYVDHPSYGVALIARVLESKGWRVGIIAQPDWRNLDDFQQLGEPRLFFGVTGGNVDSMIANLSSGKRRRKTDDCAPGDRAGLRPDRATIVYANRLREAYPAVPIVLGGLEASLRRLAHYDFWDDKVRRSVLLDARADILVYGMGERQISEIAARLDQGESLDGIRGTVVACAVGEAPPDAVVLPSYERAAADKAAYGEAFRLSYANMDPGGARTLVQPHGDRVVVQYPPAATLGTAELDTLHGLPFARRWHPRYDAQGGIRALETVRHSIISHRGCCGECTFCAITYHQGRIVQSRSEASVLQEVRVVAAQPEFRGTITDIGGPTANLHAAHCKRWDRDKTCANRRCLVPEKCPNLELGYNDCIRLYRKAAEVPGVKHVFLGSGLRHDLLAGSAADAYLRQICAHQVSGLLKVAPEHCDDGVLRLMNKPRFAVYEEFVRRFKAAAKFVGKEIFIVNYFITSHPGASLRENLKLALYLAKRRIKPEQIQDFIPAPGTLATCMYHTGRDPLTGKPVYVARNEKERRQQRAMIQYDQPRNHELLVEALTELDSLHVLHKFEQASQPRPRAMSEARGTRKPQRGRRR
jgi:uncharacterized radical SAM protein YgiQ